MQVEFALDAAQGEELLGLFVARNAIEKRLSAAGERFFFVGLVGFALVQGYFVLLYVEH